MVGEKQIDIQQHQAHSLDRGSKGKDTSVGGYGKSPFLHRQLSAPKGKKWLGAYLFRDRKKISIHPSTNQGW